MIDTILEAVKKYQPQIYTEPCEEYPTLANGDLVIVFNDDLALVYEGGIFQILYADWMGVYVNPLPVLTLLLEGYGELMFLQQDDFPVLTVRDDAEQIFPKGNKQEIE